MSRFRPRISPSGALVRPSRPEPVVPTSPFGQPRESAPLVRPAEPQMSQVQQIGFLILCAYQLSGTLNEWAIRLLHIKGYLSIATLFALPVVWLISGFSFRGLRHAIGRWWAALLVLLLFATFFSIWRGGSVELLINYIPRAYMTCFYVAALTGSFRNCRQLMYVNAAVSFMALLTCVAFGTYSEDGRYYVPGGAGFFGNSNELAMQLLIGITQFVYLLSQKGFVGKVIASVGIVSSLPYILRTGSRGCTLGAILYGFVLLYTSRHRLLVLAIIATMAVIGVASAPSAVLRRITLLSDDEPAGGSSDRSAIESQMSRIDLLKRSVFETIKHPLLGVGPGQFPVAVMEEAKARGEWFQWLGTHNAYTQVSSECGIPAFICYFAVVVLCIRSNLKLWKVSRDRTEAADINALSAALLCVSVVYAVCSFFFHMAYSSTLPLIAGQTIALQLAAKHLLRPNDGTVA